MGVWTLVYDRFEPQHERLREALCTLGNGYFATRGAAPEATAGRNHYPGTYLAGGYNRLTTDFGGETVENESLVNMPNWLPVAYRMGGEQWLDLAAVEILDYRQALDLHGGLLTRRVRFRDDVGRETTLVQRRFVHMAHQHMAGLESILVPENWSGPLEVRCALDGRVRNSGVPRYRELNNRHLQPLAGDAVPPETLWLKMQTNQSEIRVAWATRCRLYVGDEPVEAAVEPVREEDYVALDFTLEAHRGQPLRLEKIAALYTSRDRSISEARLEAEQAIGRAGRFEAMAANHATVWKQMWHRFDMNLGCRDSEEGKQAGRILRLHVFHLLQTASLNNMDLDAGVPARGLHGEAYRGHILWDELFIFPLLNLRVPEITRALLSYRYRRLGEARAAAREAGFTGAMYPWQSGSDGREESQTLHLNPQSGRWIADNTRLQRHVNAAIAYNVWEYFEVTGDVEFLSFYGAEMLLEIARFWAAIATWNPERKRFEIRGVMGPDEFHEGYPWREGPGLDNNAYTNVMAAWVMARALELRETLPSERWSELTEQLSVGLDELDRWEHMSRGMYIPFHDDHIISQFEGYERLEELDWEGYRDAYGSVHRLDRTLEAENDTPNRYKASKQADVLMLFYLFSAEELEALFNRLGYDFPRESIPRNVRYYMNRTSHGSTLSRVVHSWVLARGDRKGSWRLFRQALETDLEDIQGGTTEEGIHLGAMAGTVDLLLRGYTGIESRDGVLWLNPALPDELESLRFRIRYRGHSLDVDVSHDEIHVKSTTSKASAISLGVKGQCEPLLGGEERRVRLGPAASAG